MPILGALILALVYGMAAYIYARRETYPRKVRAAGFKGTVRDTAKFTFFGSLGGGLVASAFEKDLAKIPFFTDAMLGIAIVSILAAGLNYYMSSALDTATTNKGEAIELTSPFWEIVHGTVFGLSLAALIIVLVVVIAIGLTI